MQDFKKTNPSIESLSPQDADLLDVIIEWRARHSTDAGLESPPLGQLANGSTSAAAAQRTKTLQNVLALLNQYPAEEPAPDLADRTLATIDEARQQLRFSQQIETLSGGSSRSVFQWRDLAAVAAVILFCLTLALPSLKANRGNAIRLACAANLAIAGSAFGNYAADNQNLMPRGRTIPGSHWNYVGLKPDRPDQPVQSNSAHLAILIRNRYLATATLACPNNPHASQSLGDDMFDWPKPQALSYSYQNQYALHPTTLVGQVRIAILADKNPYLIIKRNHELTYDPNPAVTRYMHRRTGQNVLANDGAVHWTTTPRLDEVSDNIYTAEGIDHYNGTEAPTDPSDSHLVP